MQDTCKANERRFLDSDPEHQQGMRATTQLLTAGTAGSIGLRSMLQGWQNPCWSNRGASLPDLDSLGAGTAPSLLPSVRCGQLTGRGQACPSCRGASVSRDQHGHAMSQTDTAALYIPAQLSEHGATAIMDSAAPVLIDTQRI